MWGLIWLPSPRWKRPDDSRCRSHAWAAIARRYGAVLDRVALNAPYAADPDIWQQIATDLRRPR